MRDPPKRFFWAVAVDRLRLAVPERHTTLSRITHDHRIVSQIQQLGSQPQLLLVPPALGDVARRHHEVLTHRDDHAVDHSCGERGAGPRLLVVDVIGPARLAGHRHPAVDREPVTARIVGKQLPDPVAEQLLAVEPHELAVGVVDVLVAKIDDLAAIITDRRDDEQGVEHRLGSRTEPLLAGTKLRLDAAAFGRIDPRDGDLIADARDADIEVPLGLFAVPTDRKDEVVLDERLAGLDHAHERVKQPGDPGFREELKQAPADQFLAGHAADRARGVVGERANEVDDRPVGVTRRGQQHQRIDQRLERGAEPLRGLLQRVQRSALVGHINGGTDHAGDLAVLVQDRAVAPAQQPPPPVLGDPVILVAIRKIAGAQTGEHFARAGLLLLGDQPGLPQLATADLLAAISGQLLPSAIELNHATLRVEDHDDCRDGLEHDSVRRTPSTRGRRHIRCEFAISH